MFIKQIVKNAKTLGRVTHTHTHTGGFREIIKKLIVIKINKYPIYLSKEFW